MYEMPHMILAAYMVTGFTVAGVYAAGILRGRRDRYHYTGFALGFVPAAVLTPFQIFVGDTAARAIAHDQPVKFASMEYVARTSRNVPEWLGGVYVNGHVYGGLRIPDMDSLLVGFGPGTQVTGWDSVPPADRPPVVWLIHLCFDVMVGLGFLLLLAGLWALYEWWRHRRLPPQRLFWLLGAVSGLAAIVAMECGWVVTEVGRQPWVVYQLQTTAAAATTNGGVIASLSFVIALYAVLGVADHHHPAGAGPALATRRPGARSSLRPAACAAGPVLGRGRVVIADAVGGILLASVTLYAVLGGADFGGGLWDLLAGGDRRGRAPRAADRGVDHAGVGGQPRLARLRSGHLLDRVPAGVRRGDDGGRAAAVARARRDRAARRRLRLPQGSLTGSGRSAPSARPSPSPRC